MADILPSEAVKARILSIRPAPAGTPIESANVEWIEIRVELDSDLANWRVLHLRALWREDVTRPVDTDVVFSFGSPHFARAGEVYRIHSGSLIRAATHPVADDLAPGRKHVYAAGPLSGARLRLGKGDYVRLVEAFGAVIDEVVVWPAEVTKDEAPPREARAAG
ncbi:MAG: hypothetical protein HYX56_03250 [Chloroflexi bacterium]|nr:hypothetical protein [Chloroflexota bacterium]